MNRTGWLYSIIGIVILFFFISTFFHLLGFLFMVLFKYWYIWLTLIAIVYLINAISRNKPVKKYHNEKKDYIDAEYRVEGEVNDDEKKS